MASNFQREYSDDVREELATRRDALRKGTLRLNNRPSQEVFTAGGICGNETSWVDWWSELGELLTPIAYYLSSNSMTDANPMVRDKAIKSMFEFAGAPERLIYSGLDIAYKSMTSQERRGRAVLDAIVRSTDEVLASTIFEAGMKVDETSGELSVEDADRSNQVIQHFRWVILARVGEVLGVDDDVPVEFADKDVSADAVKFTWIRGIMQDNPTLGRLPGIRALAKGIAENIATESGLTAVFDQNDPFGILSREPGGLPASLVRYFSGRAGWLLKYRDQSRDQFGYEMTGIQNPGTTELDRLAFRFIFDDHHSASFAVLAPTSSGKSRLGQMAVAEAVHRRHTNGKTFGRVLFLVPTKALVNQVARELRTVFSGSDTRTWTVMEGSRDYPQYDDQIRLGKFDVAVCIPEKLSALIRMGMSLRDTPLVVLDEMQHVVDENRGQSLELLMIELFEDFPSMRWIALSASLSDSTQDMVAEWFSRNAVNIEVIRAEFRPVPLTLTAANAKSTIEYREHEHNSVVRHDRVLPAIETKVRSKELSSTLNGYRDLLRLIVSIFVNPGEGFENPSILVFTNSRRLAENLTAVCATVLGERSDLPTVDPSATPFLAGRFHAFDADLEAQESPEELWQEFSIAPPGRLRDATEDALRSGVGFHTSTLDWSFRETVEKAFRSGYIRILFATDTLKLGLNLPADVVINADFVLNSGMQRQRLMDKDSIIQRVGRAGRLGITRGMGAGFLWVEDPPRRNSKFELEIGHDERVGLTGSSEASDDAVWSATANLDKAFYYYLHPWGGGASYTAPLNDLWLEDAVMRSLLRTENLRLDISQVEENAQSLFEKSFAGVLGRPAPVHTVSRLEAAGLIRTDGAIARLTRLGRVAAMNAMGNAAAPLIERLAAAATSGAGPLTLLYNTCLSKTSHHATFQMQCRDNTSRGIRAKVMAFAQTPLKFPREGATKQYFRLQSDEAKDVVGTGIMADELRALLTAEDAADRATPAQLTALWRATTLLHWWAGRSFSKLETAIGRELWLVGETDLRQLAENISNTLASVSDYLGTAPEDMTFRSLLRFSQELEVGLPTVLSSLVRLNERAMHRERLRGLLPILFDPSVRWDNLPELLDRYFEKQEGRPERSREWKPLTPAIVKRIERHLEQQQSLLDDAAFSLPESVSNDVVPRGASRSVGDHLVRFDRGAGVDVLVELIEAFELEYEELDDADFGGVSVTLPGGSGNVLIVVAASQVNHRTLDRAVELLGTASNVMIIATRGSTAGVTHHSRFMTERCAVVEPSLFLEMIARVYSKFESAPDVFGETTPDVEKSATLLSRMLVNNAPVLTRMDLENRMRHDDLSDHE
ncbi:DEAD/DEAH box helicase [Rhodococcoides fascians]|uniref:DEAD/DEAH box helicase n=1 Tax=Rhodococcoides fascians TaxID=1828 RepID=UPI000A642AB8|nr:DEAD/DEAH box helicase [Rhodococcus fascians]